MDSLSLFVCFGNDAVRGGIGCGPERFVSGPRYRETGKLSFHPSRCEGVCVMRVGVCVHVVRVGVRVCV